MYGHVSICNIFECMVYAFICEYMPSTHFFLFFITVSLVCDMKGATVPLSVIWHLIKSGSSADAWREPRHGH